jgi:hypothetical protein
MVDARVEQKKIRTELATALGRSNERDLDVDVAACRLGVRADAARRINQLSRKIAVDARYAGAEDGVNRIPINRARIDRINANPLRPKFPRSDTGHCIALLMGALEIARLTKNTELSDELLRGGIAAAKKLISN